MGHEAGAVRVGHVSRRRGTGFFIKRRRPHARLSVGEAHASIGVLLHYNEALFM